jgi:hypothetical protein
MSCQTNFISSFMLLLFRVCLYYSSLAIVSLSGPLSVNFVFGQVSRPLCPPGVQWRARRSRLRGKESFPERRTVPN